MGRLIDADEMALNESEAYMSAQTKIENPITLGLNSLVHRKIQQIIADTPTVDAVEVVRCKDCTEWDEKEQECKHWYGFHADDFCSYGERKEGADNE